MPIAIIGPTASGKTALSLDLAEYLDAEIVNVDSMQLYKGMDIGTAKIPLDERRGIPHYQLDVLTVDQKASVAKYQQEAIRDVEDILSRGKEVILVGGSMLYVQSLVDDWQFPPTDPVVRARWQAKQDEIGVEALHDYLSTVDPQAASIIENKDPRRIIRALEVIELTGQPFMASQPPINAPARWGTMIIGLATTPEWLNPRIEQRTQLMFEQGLVDEVKSLQLDPNSTAGRAIGYAESLQYLDGTMTLEEAKERTTIGTRRYVRRQKAWFKRDPRTQWIDAAADTFIQAKDILARM